MYYRDCVAAVARAPISDVIAAAEIGEVTPWTKYYDGKWEQAGLGGDRSQLANLGDLLHSDAAYGQASGRYIMSGFTSSGSPLGVWLSFSSDGLDWSERQWLNENTGMPTLSPYISIVGQDLEDNGVVNDKCWVFSGYSPDFDGTNVRTNLQHVYAQLIDPF